MTCCGKHPKTEYRARILLAAFLAAALSAFTPAAPSAAAENSAAVGGTPAGEAAAIIRTDTDGILDPYDYGDYLKDTAGKPAPVLETVVRADAYVDSADAQIAPYADETHPGAIFWGNQTGSVTWEADIPEEGLYRIQLCYLPSPDRSGNIEFELYLNDDLPFEEAAQLSFQRMWKDANAIRRDNRGNDLRPPQVDVSEWMTADCRDKEGIYSDSFEFLFHKGVNRITLKCVRETLAIASLRIYNPEPTPSYKEYAAAHPGQDAPAFAQYFEAEKAAFKSDPSLYPISDRISPITRPYDASKIRLNTIGGLNWRYPGQWIDWEIEVPEDGDYIIVLRTRQDQLRGLFSHRRIYIDGEVPFRELSDVTYGYDENWVAAPLGGEDAYRFYLTKGRHTIRMEAIIGSMGDTIKAIEDSIYDLNTLYRKIIMITGVTPDLYRDYELDKEIPELKSEFLRIAKVLEDELARIEKSTGRKSTEGALLQEIAIQLRSLAKEPRTIPERLDRFKTNVSSLSAWMLEMKQQPLEIDYLWVAAPGTPLPRSNGTFMEKLVHEVKAFVFSFFENYDLIGNVSEKDGSITVWVGSGRDQAQIIKTMTEDMFTLQYGTGVNISLVQGTLLEATMAGKGPDVALNVARYLPVDLAVRGALSELENAPGFLAAKPDFQETAFVPYTLRGHVYAMPETQEFNMMFYRKDIFGELGIRPPETWEELYALIPVIARRNMDVGIPSIVAQAAGDTYMPFPRTFGTFLIQRGLDYYTKDFSATTFDDPRAIEVYQEFVDIYREYGLPVYYDFANRFRTGEMPLGIASYSTYNYLYIFAPEIRNLWEMVPIPGIRRPDGSVDRSEEGYGSSCVVFRKAQNQDGAMDFVFWWTGRDAQTRYAREMESLMGPAARLPAANTKTLADLPWSFSELSMLQLQGGQVREQPEIPGSYFVSRNLNNALIETIFEGGNALATLEKYNKYINEEIRRKRIEFGLEGSR